MNALARHLEQLAEPVYLSTFSALDAYFRLNSAPVLLTVTEATLIDLAKAFPSIEYPGTDWADARLATDAGDIFFLCVDSLRAAPSPPLSVLSLYYDLRARKFLDPRSVYRDLRERSLVALSDELAAQEGGWQPVADAAILLARYDFAEGQPPVAPPASPGTMSPAGQKLLLELLLTGRNPRRGFLLLKQTGFVDRHWPELARMDGTVHSKSHHPEGNVWEHSLETFAYRKTHELRLSLGLLFHDSGKPLAHPNEGRMFDGHAEIGAAIAADFLERLAFDKALIRDVTFLVRQHMLPPFISKLPAYRTEHVMSSPLFPLLLELYRCDVSATYRGPSGYYEACKTYRQYLRNVKNPFRTPDGKKMVRLYVDK